MVNFLDFIACYFLKVFAFLVQRLPYSIVIAMGRFMGSFANFFVSPKRNKKAYLNLKSAMGGKLSQKDMKRIIRKVYSGFGEDFIQTLRIPVVDKKYFENMIEVKGFEHVQSSLNKGRGGVLLTGHFGNWEYLNLTSAFTGCPIMAVARPQKMKRLDDLLNSFRKSKGCDVIIKENAVKDILKGLKNNRLIGILADQAGGPGGIFLPFFGRVASTAAGPITLALRAGCDILPTFHVRLDRGRHRIEVNPPINIPSELNQDEKIKYGVKKYLDIFGEYIAKYPHQWLWMHNKWKRTPTRKVVILSDSKIGHLKQSLFVVEQIKKAHLENLRSTKCNFKVEDFKQDDLFGCDVVEVKYKSKFMRKLCALLSILFPPLNYCGWFIRMFLDEKSYDVLSRSYADIVISCGSSLLPVNLFFKKENMAKSIVIMKPGPFSMKKFDIVIAPEHDKVKPSQNLISIDGACSQIDKSSMVEYRELMKSRIGDFKDNSIGLLLGGDVKTSRISQDKIFILISGLKHVINESNFDFFVTTSRRTPLWAEDIIEAEFSKIKQCKLKVIANRKNFQNTVELILSCSKIIIVSCESISMICEAVSSGKTVLVVNVFEKLNFSKRHKTFLDDLSQKGYIIFCQPEDLVARINDINCNGVATKVLNNEQTVYENLLRFNL